jgi:tryptophan synthase alpha chain
MRRIEQKFLELKKQNKPALVGYICSGDPTYDISLEVLKEMPKSGIDLIELGVAFLDPSGDGPIIQEASKRAIQNGISLKKTLELVKDFRKFDQKTPIVLMSYFNPFLKAGLDEIFLNCESVGVDGILIVDLPFEERDEIKSQITKSNLDLIQLIAPNSSKERISKISKDSSGFIYLISMLGITGTKDANVEDNIAVLNNLKETSKTPICIGFGIKNAKNAKEFIKIGADGVVVGSTIVEEISKNYQQNKSKEEIAKNVGKFLKDFSKQLNS